MSTLAVDLQGVTADLLRATDHPALTDALRDAIDPAHPSADAAGFDNRV